LKDEATGYKVEFRTTDKKRCLTSYPLPFDIDLQRGKKRVEKEGGEGVFIEIYKKTSKEKSKVVVSFID